MKSMWSARVSESQVRRSTIQYSNTISYNKRVFRSGLAEFGLERKQKSRRPWCTCSTSHYRPSPVGLRSVNRSHVTELSGYDIARYSVQRTAQKHAGLVEVDCCTDVVYCSWQQGVPSVPAVAIVNVVRRRLENTAGWHYQCIVWVL